MKKIYVLLICVLVSFISLAGDGTKESPFSVKEVKTKKVSSNDKYYVKGFVVGEFEANSNNKLFYEMSPWCYYLQSAFGGYVYIIADSPKEYDINNCLVIQFPNSSTFDDYGLDVHPELWRKEFIFHGTHETYNGIDGMKKIDEYELVSTDLIDETVYWNYTDDFEKGTTTPPKSGSYEYTTFKYFDSDDKWQGGYFTHIFDYGEGLDSYLTITSYKIKNGIIDDGKPKWDDLAVSLRGENASIENIYQSFSQGIGEVEFWAGNYEDYSAYKLSFTLQCSVDDGKTWRDIAKNVQVATTHNSTTNGMTLYRYEINEPKSAMIKIIKTDSNYGKGLQIDNLKISRFKAATALPNISDDELIISIQNSVVEVKNKKSGILSVYTITGQRIYYIELAEDSSDFIQLSHGLYILKFKNQVKKIYL